jgi:hypothetical protein
MGAEAAKWLYEAAPFGVLAHNNAPDPLFVYGNKAAQRLFEYEWDELTTLPSRLSAEAPDREERQHLLEQVESRGFITGYRGFALASLAGASALRTRLFGNSLIQMANAMVKRLCFHKPWT